ncbi:hypothetical protein MANES_03G175701v8 [Manihot esculenta]|uniref:Uncharacterized protein n=1 Tax=Manihot esculenta TaxID=3983 RepID=A0ACB7I1H8_MANES|nr:hypothetical protein MANES_03G175701v8 [Manihot esculenta]
MSSKRSRVVRSSSQVEIGLWNHIRPIESPVAFFERKHTLISPQRRLKSSISLQYRQKSRRLGGGLESFLKLVSCARRNYFRTKIFTCMGAFCSLECREGQMDLDVFEKEIAKATSVRLQIAGKLFTKDVHKLGFHC